MIPCDGCSITLDKPLHFFMDRGAQVRYCDDCGTIWSEFEAAHNAMAARYQKQLEAWTAEARSRLPLKVTPCDFPALAATPAGALRLG
jgi:hypothetical protein